MAEKEKFWTKVKVEVVAGLFVLITIEIFTGGWFISTLWKVVKAVGGLLGYPVPLPLWAVVLLPIAGAGGVIGLKVLARRRRKKDEVPSHVYTKDRIFDIDWVWEWEGDEIETLLGLCPECEFEIEMRFSKASLSNSEARCVSCGFSKSFRGPPKYVREQVKKGIRKRIRTGEYKKRLGSKSEDV